MPLTQQFTIYITVTVFTQMHGMDEQQQQQQRGRVPIDWNQLIDNSHSPPRDLLVVPSSSMPSDQPSAADDVSALTDHKLNESVQSMKRTLRLAPNLPDAGAKLRTAIQRYEQELNRRWEQKRLRQVPLPTQTKMFFFFFVALCFIGELFLGFFNLCYLFGLIAYVLFVCVLVFLCRTGS